MRQILLQIIGMRFVIKILHYFKALFEMETSAYWNVQLPTNLSTLISNSQIHKQRLTRFHGSENQISLMTDKLELFLFFI